MGAGDSEIDIDDDDDSDEEVEIGGVPMGPPGVGRGGGKPRRQEMPVDSDEDF